MGNRIEVYLWTMIIAGLLAAIIGHGTRIGRASLWITGILVLLWVVWTILTSPYLDRWRNKDRR